MTDSAGSSESVISAGDSGIASEAAIDMEAGVASTPGITSVARIPPKTDTDASETGAVSEPSNASAADPTPSTSAAPISTIASNSNVDPIWQRLAAGQPNSEDVVQLLMVGGIPGVCGPGRTAEERATVMNHNLHRVEVVNELWLAAPAERRIGREFAQDFSSSAASSKGELLFVFGRALFPSRGLCDFLSEVDWFSFMLYFFSFAAHVVWMYFAVPSTVSGLGFLDAAHDWVRWFSFSVSLARMLPLVCIVPNIPRSIRINAEFVCVFYILALLGLGFDIIGLMYLDRTDEGVNNWDSEDVGHRVGTFFLVVIGWCVLPLWAYTVGAPYQPMFADDANAQAPAEIERSTVSADDWKKMRLSAASILRVQDTALQLDDAAALFQMSECMFRLVDTIAATSVIERGTHVKDKYSAMVWLCLDALAHLPQGKRNPEFAFCTICSFGVTVYDCFSSMRGWYVSEPALAPVMLSVTGRRRESAPRPFQLRKGRLRATSLPGRAHVEVRAGTGDSGPSFAPGVESTGRPYSCSPGDVRVTIPTSSPPSVRKPESTGLLGLVNTVAAVWFLVHWEYDVYHVFLAAAVCGELWAQLWVGLWWCSGDAPLVAFVDPVHWVIGQRENVPAGAVRLLAGEACAAVLGVVGALTVIDYFVVGGVVGVTAAVVAAVLNRVLRGENVAVVCFVAYLSELIIEVIIVITAGDSTLVNIFLGVTAALESMILTMRLMQVLVGRSLIGKKLQVGAKLTEENCFAHPVACGYWGAVFTGHSPSFIMESVCSGSITESREIVAKAHQVGYQETFHTEALRTRQSPGWGYLVSQIGLDTSTAKGLPAEKGFTVFEVGSWYGKRYPCL